jgi:Kef-type K+ transport system membrane component KefB
MSAGLGVLSLGKAQVFRVGVGMIPRGEVGMVVAQLGLTLGVISNKTYSVVVFMAILTTLIAPPLLKAAYQGEESTPSERLHIS